MKLIPLTKGYSAMVSDEDFERVNQFKWCADVGRWTVYARRGVRREDGRKGTQKMHRFIMGVTDRKTQVDHGDSDGLNNTRENLRLATPAQNCKNQRVRIDNTTGYKGVCWNKKDEKFLVRYGLGSGRIYLGHFDCPKEAARHYNKAAFDNGDGFELLNDVFPLFPLAAYVPMKVQKAEYARLRTEKYMDGVENGVFSIKHVGISFDNRLGKWRARVNKKHVGFYLTQDEAVSARNLAKAKQK